VTRDTFLATGVVFDILQNNYLSKICTFLEDLLWHKISGPYKSRFIQLLSDKGFREHELIRSDPPIEGMLPYLGV
jgi:hypothetical protein